MRPGASRRRVSRKRPVLKRHADHVIRLCVEHHVPGASHGFQPLLDLEAGGTMHGEYHRAAACGAYGFHGGGIRPDSIHVHVGRKTC